MKPITARLLFTLLVVGLLTFIARAQEAYQLEYKFVKGKTYRYTNVSSSNITQEMMGRETKMTSGSNFTIRAV
ncbi:MAG: hypothetical protein HW374_270, partial [Bacteroidetes bacterium]|nr:hypothetical protein [Bacteroidota bacterium]